MNYWIVSDHEFVLHRSPSEALAEAERLKAKTGKAFRLYRVKSKVLPDGRIDAAPPLSDDDPVSVASA